MSRKLEIPGYIFNNKDGLLQNDKQQRYKNELFFQELQIILTNYNAQLQTGEDFESIFFLIQIDEIPTKSKAKINEISQTVVFNDKEKKESKEKKKSVLKADEVDFMEFLQSLQEYEQNPDKFPEFPVKPPPFLLTNNNLCVCLCFLVFFVFFFGFLVFWFFLFVCIKDKKQRYILKGQRRKGRRNRNNSIVQRLV